jgi:hypothetical protein
LSKFEFEKDWRVSVASVAFVLALVVGLDYYHVSISSFFSGVPFYVYAIVAISSVVGAWVANRLRLDKIYK